MKNQKNELRTQTSEQQNETENHKTQNSEKSIEEQLNLFAEIITDLLITEQNETRQATHRAT